MFDPFDPQLIVDPYPAYAKAREQAPVQKTAYGFWVLMKHADVMAFSKNRDLLLMFHEQQVLTRGEDVAAQPFMVQLEGMLGHVDPPDHTRVRRRGSPCATVRVERQRTHPGQGVGRGSGPFGPAVCRTTGGRGGIRRP